MLQSALRDARNWALRLAASLCERRVALPGGGSSLDQEWRLGLYRALTQNDALRAQRCDLGKLFVANTGRVYSSREKASMSDSIIAAGVLAPPQEFALDPRYLEAWQRMKCDVVAKITFPRLDAPPMRGKIAALEAEVRLYDFLTELVRTDVTPNLVIGLAHYRCTLQNMRNASNATLANDLSAEVNAIYLVNKVVPRPSDPVRVLLLERGRGCDLSSCLKANKLSGEQLMSLLFQVLFTLHALARRGVRHGDLHAGNVFVDLLGDRNTKLAYFLDTNTYFEVPTLGVLAKVYDWDWGGVYAAESNASVSASQSVRLKKRKYGPTSDAWPMPPALVLNDTPCDPEESVSTAACGTSGELDAYTLLTFLYHETPAKEVPAFSQFVRKVINVNLLSIAPDMGNYGGFNYRLCKGVAQERCDVAPDQMIAADAQCRGFGQPKACHVMPIVEMLQQPEFAQFRHSLRARYPQTEYVFGDWQSKQQRDDLMGIIKQRSAKQRIAEISIPNPFPATLPGSEQSMARKRIAKRQRQRQRR